MIGGVFDRYWIAKIAVRFAAIAAIIPVILALENVRRLLSDVEKCRDAVLLLVRLTLSLVPEHLGEAVPVALMLGCALAVRQMILRGEWQIAAAAGMSRWRIMTAPLAFAALVGGAQLVIRLELRPAGERALDAVYREVQSGDHGLPLPVGQPIDLDARTTLFIGAIGDGHVLEDVVVRRGGDSFSAPRADIGFSLDGDIRLQLLDGVGVVRTGSDPVRAVRFDRMDFSGKPPAPGIVEDDAAHRFDQLSGSGLLERARNGTETERAYALTALVMRVDSALFCLLIPWFAIPLGKPPRRKESGFGILASIVLVVLHLKLAASIEAHPSTQIFELEALHLGLWVVAAVALNRLEHTHGDGVVDVLAGRLVATLRQLRKRPQPAEPPAPVAMLSRDSRTSDGPVRAKEEAPRVAA